MRLLLVLRQHAEVEEVLGGLPGVVAFLIVADPLDQVLKIGVAPTMRQNLLDRVRRLAHVDVMVVSRCAEPIEKREQNFKEYNFENVFKFTNNNPSSMDSGVNG